MDILVLIYIVLEKASWWSSSVCRPYNVPSLFVSGDTAPFLVAWRTIIFRALLVGWSSELTGMTKLFWPQLQGCKLPQESF